MQNNPDEEFLLHLRIPGTIPGGAWDDRSLASTRHVEQAAVQGRVCRLKGIPTESVALWVEGGGGTFSLGSASRGKPSVGQRMTSPSRRKSASIISAFFAVLFCGLLRETAGVCQ